MAKFLPILIKKIMGNISANKLYQSLNKKEDIVLLDVRKPQFFSAWHIPGSMNIPLSLLDQRAKSLSKNRKIITICNHGVSSQYAANFLKEQGFNVEKLDRGLSAWNNIYDVSRVLLSGPSSVKVYQIKRLGKGCLSYVVQFKNEKAFIFDPSRHIDYYIDFIEKKNLKVIAVCDTHVHADHISGGFKLSKRLKVPYLLPKKSKSSIPYEAIEDILPEKSEAKIKIIETPGHTVESLCIIIDDAYILTGDTLFIKSVGRSDLGTNIKENASLIYKSITQKLFNLGNKLIVLPGHSPRQMLPGSPAIAESLGDVKRNNFISKFRSAKVFMKTLSESSLPTPPNYKLIKKINRTGKIEFEDLDELELGENSCAAN